MAIGPQRFQAITIILNNEKNQNFFKFPATTFQKNSFESPFKEVFKTFFDFSVAWMVVQLLGPKDSKLLQLY